MDVGMTANPIYSPALLGRLQHTAIQLAAQRSGGFPSKTELDAIVAGLVRQSVRAPAHRIALKARLGALAGRYLAEFALPARTELVGSEVSVAGGRLDLLWRLPSRLLLADELKGSGLSGAFDGDLVRAQLARQLAGATARYGEAFLGVRLVCLANPAASRLLHADGRVEPLDRGASLL